jgi:hypothetical protein
MPTREMLTGEIHDEPTPLKLAKTALFSSLLAGCAAPILLIYIFLILVFDDPSRAHSGDGHALATIAGMLLALVGPLLFSIPLIRARGRLDSGIRLATWNESQIAEAHDWMRSSKRKKITVSFLALYLGVPLLYLTYCAWAYTIHAPFKLPVVVALNLFVFFHIPSSTLNFLREKLTPEPPASSRGSVTQPGAPLRSDHWGARTCSVQDSQQ